MKLLVGNVQRLCIHDGPGLRTTIFLKGCSIRCPWCSNPENQQREILHSIHHNRTYGQWMESEEVIKECIKDAAFYGDQGGVTFSGGEPLLWAKELTPVLDKLRLLKIDTCIETSLFAPIENVTLLVNKLSRFIIDVKSLETEICSQILGGNLEIFWHNLQLVETSGIKITYRVPLASGSTFRKSNLALLQNFMFQRADAKFEVFRCHSLGHEKYVDLGLTPSKEESISNEAWSNFLFKLSESGIKVKELTL